MVKQVQVERVVRSGWWSLWLTLLVVWGLWQAYALWDLSERAETLRRAPQTSSAARAGANIGVAIGYNVGLNRIFTEWAICSGVLAVLLFIARGRKKTETIWVDDKGNEVMGPDAP